MQRTLLQPCQQWQDSWEESWLASCGMHSVYFDWYGKNGQQKTTCFATLLRIELNSDVARFTTYVKRTLQPDLLHVRQVRRWVIKRATSPFNSFCSSVAKLITGFLLPVLNNTKPLQWTGVPESLGMNMKLTVWLLLHNCYLKVNCYCKLHLLAFYYLCCRYISFKHWVIFAGDKLQ